MWKPTGKVLTTIGHQWRPTGRIFDLGNQCPLTKFTPPKVVSATQHTKRASRTDRPLVCGFRLLKIHEGESLVLLVSIVNTHQAIDKMADVNAPSDQTPTMAPPVRADDQILPHISGSPEEHQPSTEQLYEGFTATVYPNVQENLKLAVEEPVLLDEPASSSGTLSSLQHLCRDFFFEDQFFSDKPLDADKSTETEVESMVNVPIQQALSSISLMTSPINDLTSRPEFPKEHQQLKATTTDTTTTTTTLPPPQAPQQSTTEAMMVKRIGELEHILANLIQVNKTMEERDLLKADMKEILHQRMWESDSYKAHEDHMQLFQALTKSINQDHFEELMHDLAEARKKRKKGRESPKMPPGSPSHQPPPPPPPAGPSGTSGAPRAFGSQVTPPPPPPTSTNQDSPSKGSATPSPTKMAATTEHQAWSTLDVTLKPLVSLTPEDLDMDEAIGRPTTPEPAWSIRSSDVPIPMNNWASTLASNYSPHPEDSLLAQTECHKLLIDSVDDPILRHNVSKPLPLGGPPGQVTIQSDFFFNKDLEYLRYGSKGRRPALSISKMKAAYYPDAGLQQMVPDQFLIEEECKYDIAAMTHMRILSVVRIEVFFMYGYDYMKKIVLRRADLNEHVIAERDFKYLYPSEFEDLNLLNLQGHLHHLPPKDKKIFTTTVNQWTRQLVIRQRVEDFQLGIESYQTQDQQDESRSKYIVLDQEGRRSVQRVHVHNSEAFEDTENLPQPGELCWRTRQRGRLQTFKAYRLIKLLQHSWPLSDDL
nr:hypothetical protein [Tanacetum cinerariifolium]